MASSTEEVSGTNDVSTDSKQHDTTDTEQKFGMYMREFDFLEYELESLEVIFNVLNFEYLNLNNGFSRAKALIISIGAYEGQASQGWKELKKPARPVCLRP